MGKKKRIILVLCSVVDIRSYFDTGLVSKLREYFDIDVYISRDWNSNSEIKQFDRREKINYLDFSKKRCRILAEIIILAWFEFRHRSNALLIKRDRLSKKKQILFYCLSTPTLVAKALIKIALFSLGVDQNLVRWLRGEKPAGLWIISALNEPFSIELLKSAKRAGVPTCVSVHNWDNLVTKGTILVKPDLLAVWGQQHYEDAIKIQLMKSESIRIVGAPAFEVYQKNVNLDEVRRAFRALYSLPADTSLVLLCGSCYPFDELTALKTLDRLIEERELKKTKIIYRPHPWGCVREGEAHFSKYKFKNVLMDHQVESIYNSRFDESGEVKVKEIVAPDMNYYNSMLKSIDACIAPYTTLLVEAALNQVPMMILGYFDGVNTTVRGDYMANFDHARALIGLGKIKVTDEPKNLETDFLALLAQINDPEVKDRIARAGHFIVRSDEESCEIRLKRVLEEMVDEQKDFSPHSCASRIIES